MFTVIRRYLALTGILNNKCGIGLLNVMSVMFVVGLNSIGWMSSLMYIYLLRENVVETCIAVVVVMLSTVSILKLYMFQLFKKKVGEFFDDMSTIRDEPQFKQTMLFVKAYIYVCIVALFLWNASPAVNGTGKFPTPLWFPFDLNVTIFYAVAYLIHIGLSFSVCGTQAMLDSTFVLMATALIIRLKSLNKRLKHVESEKMPKQKYTLEIKKELNGLLNSHSTCIVKAAELSQIVGFVFLFQLAQTVFMACFLIYALSEVKTNSDMPKVVLCIAATFLQLFCFCWFGQTVANSFEEIHYRLFWWFGMTDLSLSEKKCFVVAQSLSVNPKNIEATLFTMSLRTFMMAVRESVGYYMFLRTVFQLKEDA